MAGRGDRIETLAERLIVRACRGLPDGLREELVAEWSGELPAILTDASRRFYLRRAWTALRFAHGQFGNARRMAPTVSRNRGARAAVAVYRWGALVSGAVTSFADAHRRIFTTARILLYVSILAQSFLVTIEAHGAARIALLVWFSLAPLLATGRILWAMLRLHLTHPMRPRRRNSVTG